MILCAVVSVLSWTEKNMFFLPSRGDVEEKEQTSKGKKLEFMTDVLFELGARKNLRCHSKKSSDISDFTWHPTQTINQFFFFLTLSFVVTSCERLPQSCFWYVQSTKNPTYLHPNLLLLKLPRRKVISINHYGYFLSLLVSY